MKKEDSGYFFQILSTAVALSLPLLQFTFFWLPPNIKELYISKDLFAFSSIVTALVSYLVILMVSREPYGSLKFPLVRKYTKDFTNKKSWQPITIQYQTLSRYCISIAFLLGVAFVYLGTVYSHSARAGALQSAVYSLIIIMTVFSSAEHFTQRKFMHDGDERRATRSLTAINLAKEANAFPEMPNIHLIGSEEQPSQFTQYGNDLITYVEINGIHYAINTDVRIGAINSVTRVPVQVPAPVEDSVKEVKPTKK